MKDETPLVFSILGGAAPPGGAAPGAPWGAIWGQRHVAAGPAHHVAAPLPAGLAALVRRHFDVAVGGAEARGGGATLALSRSCSAAWAVVESALARALSRGLAPFLEAHPPYYNHSRGVSSFND